MNERRFGADRGSEQRERLVELEATERLDGPPVLD
jgi:hypothetical protein